MVSRKRDGIPAVAQRKGHALSEKRNEKKKEIGEPFVRVSFGEVELVLFFFWEGNAHISPEKTY